MVNILGTVYEIIVKRYEEDEAFKRLCIVGYCDEYAKQLIICDAATCDNWDKESAETVAIANNETIRHEIVHAFLAESGLTDSSLEVSAWAKNEEMIDWIAMQGPKICKAWKEVGAIDG